MIAGGSSQLQLQLMPSASAFSFCFRLLNSSTCPDGACCSGSHVPFLIDSLDIPFSPACGQKLTGVSADGHTLHTYIADSTDKTLFIFGLSQYTAWVPHSTLGVGTLPIFYLYQTYFVRGNVGKVRPLQHPRIRAGPAQLSSQCLLRRGLTSSQCCCAGA
jgi:hypothetical protein